MPYKDKKKQKEYDKKRYSIPKIKAKIKERQSTPEYKAKQKELRESPEAKEKQKGYKAKPEYKAKQKEYNSKPNVKAKKKEHNSSIKVKTKRKGSIRKKRIELKLEVYSHYSKEISNSDVPICDCCEYLDLRCLVLDHINGRKPEEKGLFSLRLWKYVIEKGFPLGYQVLCHNCNFMKGSKKLCPHQLVKHENIVKRKEVDSRSGRKEKQRESQRNRNISIKLQVFTHYSKEISKSDVPICECCGYTDIRSLSLDHINGRKSEEKRLAGIKLWRYVIKKGFPLGYQVLCHNCNIAKGSKKFCPHQSDKIKKLLLNILVSKQKS